MAKHHLPRRFRLRLLSGLNDHMDKAVIIDGIKRTEGFIPRKTDGHVMLTGGKPGNVYGKYKIPCGKRFHRAGGALYRNVDSKPYKRIAKLAIFIVKIVGVSALRINARNGNGDALKGHLGYSILHHNGKPDGADGRMIDNDRIIRNVVECKGEIVNAG